MALALILRNASKMQVGVGALPRNLFKASAVVMTRDVSCSPCQQYRSTLNKNQNLELLSQKHLLRAPQVRLMSEDHTKMWSIEKALSVGLLFMIPAAIAVPNFVFDNLLSISAVLHLHWGLEAVAVDYGRPLVVGPVISKVLLILVYIMSTVTLGGLIYYNINEIGVGRTIRKLWSLNKEK